MGWDVFLRRITQWGVMALRCWLFGINVHSSWYTVCGALLAVMLLVFS